MLTAVAVIASMVFIGWLIYRAVRQRPIKAHTVVRGLSYIAAIYTFAFFLSMSFPQLIKIVVSILLGALFSAAIGILTLRLLYSLIVKARLYIFGIYCVLLGMLTLYLFR